MTFLFFLSDLLEQYNDLVLAARVAASAVNARGATLPARLRDIRERAHKIAYHGIRRGAAEALASTQIRLRHDLHQLRPRTSSDREAEKLLAKSFQAEAHDTSLSIGPQEVVQKVFSPWIGSLPIRCDDLAIDMTPAEKASLDQ